MGSPVSIIGGFSSKNYIINGGVDIIQRISGQQIALTTSGGVYYADRWQSAYQGSWTGQTPFIFQTPANPSAPDFLAKQCLGVLGNPTNSSDSFNHAQRIEGAHAHPLANQNCSVGYWIFPQASTCQTQIQLFYPTAGEDNWGGSNPTIFTSSFSASLPAGMWSYISFNNIPLPANVVNGLTLSIIVSNWGTTGNNSTGAYVTEIMLNQGAVANRFTRFTSNLQSELLLCQRYCWNPFAFNAGVGPGGGQTVLLSSAQNTAGVAIGNFPTTMRIAPTVQLNNPGGAGDFYHTPFNGSSIALLNFNGDQRSTTAGYFNSFNMTGNIGSTPTPGCITIKNSLGKWFYEAEIG